MRGPSARRAFGLVHFRLGSSIMLLALSIRGALTATFCRDFCRYPFPLPLNVFL